MSITPTHRSITVGTGCFVVSRGLHHKLEQGVLGWEGSPFLHVCSNPVQDHKWHITYNINVHCTSDQYCYRNCYQVVNAVTFNHQSTNLRRRGKKNIILLNTSTAADQSYDLECVYKGERCDNLWVKYGYLRNWKQYKTWWLETNSYTFW